VSLTTITTALAGFESARRLRTLHGHGFVASVAAQLPAGWAPYAGGEVPALQQRLEAAVQPLHDTLLNDTVADPGDAGLARWIAQRVDLPGLQRAAVQSSERQGAVVDVQGRVTLWRRYRFQSAHRLPHVSPGHKCGRMHGHGFEAIVLVRADDAATTHDTLDAAWAPLHMRLNYRCLNDLRGLDNPTSELLSSWLWNQLRPSLPALTGVTVFETASCGSHFDGSDWRIWKDFTFDSASVLRHAPAGDPRAQLHGHTYLLRLHLHAPLVPRMGWAVDFGDVKTLFTPVFNAVDHRPLHEIAGLENGDSATLAAWIHAHGKERLPQLERVDLHETRGCGTELGSGAMDRPWLPA
jgi:6-pyruvoyltetrahydropterin/6-carboxytetrahydropterin synthase